MTWTATLDELWTRVTAEPRRAEPPQPQEPRFLRRDNLLDAFAHQARRS